MKLIDVTTHTTFDPTVIPRPAFSIGAAYEAVTPLIEAVRADGLTALAEQAERFDGVAPASIAVPQSVIDAALAATPTDITDALEAAIAHARIGHEAQLPEERSIEIVAGGWVRQRYIPVRRVGLYVPGGLAVYPSSVVMNVVPAQVAGVDSIAVASPAQKEHDGWPHPTILAACALLGIEEVYAMGGAGAIGAFAYGIPGEIEPVDVICGPGNIYVAAAKRYVRGTVGIDAEAGTTEIAILADDAATPRYVAADLISQAEHDPNAASVLVTPSRWLADKVAEILPEMIAATKHRERVATALDGPQSGIILTRDMDQAIDVVNSYGPEHLEIHCAHAHDVAEAITNAGAIFIGDYTPVPLGDYIAGSNHVLPTGGTARFASGLGVHSFIKSVQQVEYSVQAMHAQYEHLAALAIDEDLPAHANAVHVRIEEGE